MSKHNGWLTDPIELAARFPNVEDQAYLLELTTAVSKHLHRCPIRVTVVDHGLSSSLAFKTKQQMQAFPIDSRIAVYDFIYMVESQWLSKFFPSYSVELEVDELLTADELVSLVEEVPVDALLPSSQGSVVRLRTYWGRISKIALMDDRFKIETDGGVYWRITKLPLSQFLDQLRGIETDVGRKDYIEANSHIVNRVQNVGGTKVHNLLHYTADQTLSFLDIRKEQLAKQPLQALPLEGPYVYQWGQFVFKFISDSHLEKGRQIIGESIWQKYNKQAYVVSDIS